MEVLKDREGMLVYRDGNTAVKHARDKENIEGLRNSYRFLSKLSPEYVPSVVEYTGNKLAMEYIKPVEVTDTEKARRNSIKMLNHFRRKGIIHGDLTAVNIIFTHNNMPVAIDWDQSNFWSEPKPQKRPKPDAEHMWPAIVKHAGDPSRVIRRWIEVRKHIEYYLPWGTFLDLGTHQGDFVGMACAEGMTGYGVDNGQIRSDCLDTANALWKGEFEEDVRFILSDIDQYLQPLHTNEMHIGMYFSTWVYHVHDFGLQIAADTLRKAIEVCEILFFETQLFGDGPGIPQHKTIDDVYTMLSDLTSKPIEKVVTIPVGGRPAERTVWKVG